MAGKVNAVNRKLLFAEEYLKDLSATNAAIRAGYSEKTAYSMGARLLKDIEVATHISQAMERRAAKTEITQDRVLEEFATAAFLNPKEMFREDGRLLPIHDMSDRAARAICSFEVEEIFEGVGEDRIWIGYLKKVKLVSKEGTLNSTARHLGMFNDKLAVVVDDKRVEALQAAQARAEKLRGSK